MTVPTIFEGISDQPEATSLDGLFFAAESADPLDPTVKVPLDLVRDSYRGLWPDTGGEALKGDTFQTQVSGTPTGQYFTALQNTAVDPVGDDVNWRAVNDSDSIYYEGGSVKDKLDTLGTASEKPDYYYQESTAGSRNKFDMSYCDRIQSINPYHAMYVWDDLLGSGYYRIGFQCDDSYVVEYRYSNDADGFLRLQQVKFGKATTHANGTIILNDSSSVLYFAHDNSVLEFALNVRKTSDPTSVDYSWVPRHGTESGATSNQSQRWMIDGLTDFSLPTEPVSCSRVSIQQKYDANQHYTSEYLWAGLITYDLGFDGLFVDHKIDLATDLIVYQGYLSMLPARNETYSKLFGSHPLRADGIPVDGTQPVFESTLFGNSACFVSPTLQAGRASAWAIDVLDVRASMGDYFTPGGSKSIQVYDRNDGISKLYYPFSKGQSTGSTIRYRNRYFCAPSLRSPVAGDLI